MHSKLNKGPSAYSRHCSTFFQLKIQFFFRSSTHSNIVAEQAIETWRWNVYLWLHTKIDDVMLLSKRLSLPSKFFGKLYINLFGICFYRITTLYSYMKTLISSHKNMDFYPINDIDIIIFGSRCQNSQVRDENFRCVTIFYR